MGGELVSVEGLGDCLGQPVAPGLLDDAVACRRSLDQRPALHHAELIDGLGACGCKPKKFSEALLRVGLDLAPPCPLCGFAVV